MSDKRMTMGALQERITRGPFNSWLDFKVIKFDENGLEVRATWREEITIVYAAWAVGLLIWFVIRPPEAPKVFFRMMRQQRKKGTAPTAKERGAP